MGKESQNSVFNFSLQEFDLNAALLNSHIHSAITGGTASYKIFRRLRFALNISLEEFFDQLALKLGWNSNRIDTGELLMISRGLHVRAYGNRKSNYCSCVFEIWAESLEQAENANSAILALAEPVKINKPIASICWAFLSEKGQLKKANIEELLEDEIHDEAYPEMIGGVRKFVSDFLSSTESVLVVQGKPGTGKTKLIRSILAAMTSIKNEQVSALYTGDKQTLESDEIFVDFVTGDDEVFILEDADYILKPRSEGNDNLHRFLTIADGVVRSQGRKIIFSTNLPNVGDIDDALIRPGRCFARVLLRELTKIEAIKLLERLCEGDIEKSHVIAKSLTAGSKDTFSLAEVYKLHRNVSSANTGEQIIKRISDEVGCRIGF